MSAARRESARFIAASSASPVVSPASGWTPVTPRKNRSALTACAASTAAAPQVTAECLKSIPPSTKTSTVGCSTSAAATVGLCVTTVARNPGGSACAIASVVVPPSRITVAPGSISSIARRATRALLSTATVRRAA